MSKYKQRKNLGCCPTQSSGKACMHWAEKHILRRRTQYAKVKMIALVAVLRLDAFWLKRCNTSSTPYSWLMPINVLPICNECLKLLPTENCSLLLVATLECIQALFPERFLRCGVLGSPLCWPWFCSCTWFCSCPIRAWWHCFSSCLLCCLLCCPLAVPFVAWCGICGIKVWCGCRIRARGHCFNRCHLWGGLQWQTPFANSGLHWCGELPDTQWLFVGVPLGIMVSSIRTLCTLLPNISKHRACMQGSLSCNMGIAISPWNIMQIQRHQPIFLNIA